jgi:hypothetical protein
MTEPLPHGAAATLRALLTGTDPVGAALRAQIPYTRVTRRCGCGCATVDLVVDPARVPPAPAHDNPAADAWYAVPDDAGVLVFTVDGYLASLEIYSTADEPITDWPEPHFAQL